LIKHTGLDNKRFGYLTVLHRVPNATNGDICYFCRCDCGQELIVRACNLIHGRTKSCGCMRRSLASVRKTKHGDSGGHGGTGTRLYRIWRAMLSRCNCPSATEYQNYGGRGVCVCNEWKNDYASFREWAFANGYDDHLTIDRIDNDGNYDPSNCRWVTMKVQMNNKSSCHYLEYNGKTQTISEWAREIGISRSVLSQRINRYHWPIEKALTLPIKNR